MGANEGRWSIGVVTDSLNVWSGYKAEAQREFLNFVNRLRNEKDLTLDQVKLTKDFNQAHSIHSTIYDKTLSYYFREEFQKHTLVSPIMYEIVKRGNQISPDQYQLALKEQSRLSILLDQELKKNDVVITLSTAGSAPLFGADDVPDSCLIWTLCGIPALNIPLFRDSKGLPYGLQVFSRRYTDKRLLRFARRLETLAGDQLKLLPPEWKQKAPSPV